MTTHITRGSSPLIPILSEQSKGYFVDEKIKASDDVIFGGTGLKSGFLKFGKTLSLLGLSQTDELLSSGVIDTTDSLDCNVRVSQIVFEDGTVVDVSSLPTSVFVFQEAGNYRLLNLRLVAHDVSHKKFNVFGTVNLETSELEVQYSEIAGEDLASKPAGYKILAFRTNSNINPLSPA